MNTGFTDQDRHLAADLSNTWHISKSIPISIILFLLAQTAGIIVWATRIEFRVTSLENTQPAQDARLNKLEDIYARMAVMDERQGNITRRLDIQTRTMQDILELVRAWKDSTIKK